MTKEQDHKGTGGWVSLKSAAQSQHESEMMRLARARAGHVPRTPITEIRVCTKHDSRHSTASRHTTASRHSTLLSNVIGPGAQKKKCPVHESWDWADKWVSTEFAKIGKRETL
ncbi:hypothetical protein NDA11_006736 [Ustilago hordei]|uniref:Uncharacterized protein n=1 Tax=Ustilago hordei TaxID=120017 RepID=I2G4H8_USTHO|nr:uncharacterized protein UHO2_01214 [Ustilago hordei]KAJ1044493.1 hypothetical protein NDA10_003286 [Ustilago hordei]KAJ1583329.1 hypothetical protein NDA15_002597 [Ustilago hordei]KAJ1586847.1 hypothetical protein NDA11_006736 [Ustilago hordei]KAJ1591926.1 hypothetical protein NDA12_004058 [Ustilago hordei]KAJ1603054.1 hypothetical protein NDA14_003186 [Ustilago hordei]